jgi:hypothetical protein
MEILPVSRISQAQRERATEWVRTCAGEGILDTEELERRIEYIQAAKIHAQLKAAMHDLPPMPYVKGQASLMDGGATSPSDWTLGQVWKWVTKTAKAVNPMTVLAILLAGGCLVPGVFLFLTIPVRDGAGHVIAASILTGLGVLAMILVGGAVIEGFEEREKNQEHKREQEKRQSRGGF